MSNPGTQVKEVLSGPKSGCSGQRSRSLPAQAPSTQQAGPYSVSLLNGMAWVAVSGTRGGASLLRGVPCSFLPTFSPRRHLGRKAK